MKMIPSSLQTKSSLLLIVSLLTLASWLSCVKKYSSENNTANNINYLGNFIKVDTRDSTLGYGTVTATFDKTTLKLNYSITWHSLTSIPIGIHFHDAGPVIVQITGFPIQTNDTVSGTATLTSSQANDLAAGAIYAMIHTQTYPSGELKANLVKQ